MPFVKLDCGILKSTLWLDRGAREVFVTALLMAAPREFDQPVAEIAIDATEPTGWVAPAGWYGFVDAASIAIIEAARLEPEEGFAALRRLAASDPHSRSVEFEGRRMIRVDGGFLILNYMKYRDFDHGAAMRMRRLRQRRKSELVTANGDAVTPNARHESLDSDALRRHVTYSREQIADKQKAEQRERGAHAPTTHVTANEKESQEGGLRGCEIGTRLARTSARRATRLPEPFELTDERRAVAERDGVDADRTHRKFCDYWRSASGRTAAKLDWDATWRNWCLTEAERSGGYRANGTGRRVPAKSTEEIETETIARMLGEGLAPQAIAERIEVTLERVEGVRRARR